MQKDTGVLGLSRNAWIGVVALAIILAVAWSRLPDDRVPLTLDVTVSAEALVRLEHDQHCDLDDFSMMVKTNAGAGTEFKFADGQATSIREPFCSFVITENVPEASTYRVTFMFDGGEWGPRTISADDALQDDGSLAATVRW